MNYKLPLIQFAASRTCQIALTAGCLAAGCLASAAAAQAQTSAGASGKGIYTCIDASGKRLSADRPIAECIDREQRELSGSGATRRVIGPTLSITEREALEARQREEARQRQRAQEGLRRDRALLARYPDKDTHNISRSQALAVTHNVEEAARQRLVELSQERKTLNDEMEFYSKDPSRAPGALRRRIESNDQGVQRQQQAIAEQEAERARINARFDEELARLQQLWRAKPGDRP